VFLTVLFEDPLLFLRVIFIVVFSVTLHELGHGMAALSQGDRTPLETGHMTANPVVHTGWPSLIFLCVAGIAWGAMPVNPRRFRDGNIGNIIVAAAGPAMNLAIAGMAAIVMKLAGAFPSSFLSVDFFFLLARTNIVLLLFNLLPVPPLDGFRVWSEVVPGLRGLEKTPFGMLVLMLLFATGVGRYLVLVADSIVAFWFVL